MTREPEYKPASCPVNRHGKWQQTGHEAGFSLEPRTKRHEEGLRCSFFTISAAAAFSVQDELKEAGNLEHFATHADYPIMAEQMLLRSGFTPRIIHPPIPPTPVGEP